MYFVKFTDDKVRWIGTQAQFVEFLEYMHVIFNAIDSNVTITQLGDIFLKIIHIDISPYKGIGEMLDKLERTPVGDNVLKALDIASFDIDLHDTIGAANISPSEAPEMSAEDLELKEGHEEFMRLMQQYFDFSG